MKNRFFFFFLKKSLLIKVRLLKDESSIQIRGGRFLQVTKWLIACGTTVRGCALVCVGVGAYECTSMRGCEWVHMGGCWCLSVCEFEWVYMSLYGHVNACMCVGVYVCVCVCLCACVRVWERETERDSKNVSVGKSMSECVCRRKYKRINTFTAVQAWEILLNVATSEYLCNYRFAKNFAVLEIVNIESC